MKRTSLFMGGLLALASACVQGVESPQYSRENLCVENDFVSSTFFSNRNDHYALGTEVHFALTHPVTEYETHIELIGGAFEWHPLADGSLEAHAVQEGTAELQVYIDGQVVDTQELQVSRPTAAKYSESASLLLAFARFHCEDCVGIDDGKLRVALGASTRLSVAYENDAGDSLEGRGLGDDEFVDVENGRDSLNLFTDLEGLFSLPMNVDGRQLAMVSYRVAEVATLRIAYGSLNGPGMYFVEALDANGMTLIGEPEWFIDDVPVEPEYGVIMPDEVEGSTIRVRMGGAEATLEVL